MSDLGRLLACGGLCLVAFSALARTAEALVIHSSAGSETVLFLSERPTLLYNEKTVTVLAPTLRTEIDLKDIEKMTFESREVSVSSMSSTVEDCSMKVDISNPDVLRVFGLQPGREIYVSTVLGRSLGTYIADANGSVEMSLSTMPSGTVIIITGNHNSSIKVRK